MKGANEELCATTINAPSRNNTAMIGKIHNRRPPKNENSWPATLRLRLAVRRNFIDPPRVSGGWTDAKFSRDCKSHQRAVWVPVVSGYSSALCLTCVSPDIYSCGQ